MSAVGAFSDAITTIDAKRDPNIYERNKVINWHKHNDAVIFGGIFIAGTAITWLVADLLKGKYRTGFLTIMAVGNLAVFGNNLIIKHDYGGK